LAYRAKKGINELVDQIITEEEPVNDIITDDNIQHRVWLVQNPKMIQRLAEEFKKVPCLYVADGHHRTASAYNVGKLLLEKANQEGNAITGEEPFNYFLSVLFPSDQLQILDYNRVVKDLNGHDVHKFLKKLKQNFNVTKVTDKNQAKPDKKGVFGMFLEGQWYSLVHASKLPSDPVLSLDVSILTDKVLLPILGIKDLRTDERIDFVGGTRGLGELEKLCSKGGAFQVAFALFPVSVDELMSIADSNQLMPPKSTWFEPKLRSGLIVRMLEDKVDTKKPPRKKRRK